MRCGAGQWTLGEVRNVSGDPRGGTGRVVELGRFLEWVGRPLGMSETGRVGPRRVGEVWDGSVDPRGCPERVAGPSGRSRTGRGTLEEDQDWSGTLVEVRNGFWGGLGSVVEDMDGSGDPSGRLEKHRENLGEGRDGSGNPRRSPGWVGGPSGWSGTDRGTRGEFRDGSGEPLRG